MSGKKKRKIKAKKIKQQLQRVYDAGQSNNYHKAVRAGGNSPDSVNHTALVKLRGWARYLDENHDLAIGVLDNVCNRVVANGLTIEPLFKRSDGSLDERVNDELRDLWQEFWLRPEVTGELTGPQLESLACRALFRDGEILTQHIQGTGSAIEHNGLVPYSVEMLEADYLPMDLNGDRITHGVEKTPWGKPVRYHLYAQHPGNTVPFNTFSRETRIVDASVITHSKFVRRFRQTRGVPLLHGVIHRLDDIKDYSESERIKARVNAAFTAYIKRSLDYSGDVDADANREMSMQSGIIFDGLAVGEEIASVGTDSPNPNLGPFIAEMMRAVAAGTNTSHSSISRHYDGNYSAQRQEQTESKAGYDFFSGLFVGGQMMPIWKRFIDIILASRMFALPMIANKTPQQVLSLLYRSVDMRGPGVPWVDQQKEVNADLDAIAGNLTSRQEVIRKRGGDPRQVDQEIKADKLRREQMQAEAEAQAQAEAEPPTADEDDEDDDQDEAEAA